jgi:hypothetical protein
MRKNANGYYLSHTGEVKEWRNWGTERALGR